MKLGGILACLAVVGCGAAPKAPVASVTNTSGASVNAARDSQAASAPAKADIEPKADGDAKPAEDAGDPPPKVVFTPPAELRKNTRATFEAALKAVKRQSSPGGAAASLTRSLGKPTWIENDSRQVWSTMDTTQCIRIVLDEDGSVSFEGMRSTEFKRVSRTARQNLCTGQIDQDE
jgi:hypothetical protein